MIDGGDGGDASDGDGRVGRLMGSNECLVMAVV